MRSAGLALTLARVEASQKRDVSIAMWIRNLQEFSSIIVTFRLHSGRRNGSCYSFCCLCPARPPFATLSQALNSTVALQGNSVVSHPTTQELSFAFWSHSNCAHGLPHCSQGKMAGRLWSMGESAVNYARDLVLPRVESTGGPIPAAPAPQHSNSFTEATASEPLIMQPSNSLTAPDINDTPAVGGSDALWHPQVRSLMPQVSIRHSRSSASSLRFKVSKRFLLPIDSRKLHGLQAHHRSARALLHAGHCNAVNAVLSLTHSKPA